MSGKLLVAPALAQPRRSGRKIAGPPGRYANAASEEDASDFEEEASSPYDAEEREGRPKREFVGTKRKRGGKKGKAARRSRYVGVSWKKRDQKWKVQIKVRGVLQHLGVFDGVFDDEAEGARAYDAAVVAQNLGYPLNFPGDTGAGQAFFCFEICNPHSRARPSRPKEWRSPQCRSRCSTRGRGTWLRLS